MLMLSIAETNGLDRVSEPITIGIPFPKGYLFNDKNLFLIDTDDNPVDLQTEILDCWSDKSVRWLLLDFSVSVRSRSSLEYRLILDKAKVRKPPAHPVLIVEKEGKIAVNTGPSAFELSSGIFKPFDRVIVEGSDIIVPEDSNIVILDKDGRMLFPVIRQRVVETKGPIRATIKVEGTFRDSRGNVFINFVSRLSFFAGRSFVKMDFTVHNPRRARHKGGLWDLGDKGSVFFKDLSIISRIKVDEDRCFTRWRTNLLDGCVESNRSVRIYQDSSGGRNWRSHNHINREGRIPNSFCGYRVYEDGDVIAEGRRAEPALILSTSKKRISCVVRNFWQNFPKALETDKGCLIIRLFPEYYQDLFELQGGEQKTHTVYLGYGKTGSSDNIEFALNPLRPRISPQWYRDSGVFPYLALPEEDPDVRYKELVNCAIEGDDTFFEKREKIDEYGWRNFGCLYADHEAIRKKEGEPLVSHYNNQYDALYGFLLHYARTGEVKWYRLADDLARHTVDIDIYHTREDKSAYNGGLFWHTEHYTDAYTSTHRTYTKETLKYKKAKYCGGGPSDEHNYTTGLLYMYFFTGEKIFRDAVIGLANWVIDMDDGRNTVLRFLDKGPTGLASRTAECSYHGPGRGAGNSINALMDAYILTKQRRYIDKLEELIRRCVHPEADINAQRLDEPEYRWSYLVFFQALGRYLDYKIELGEKDYMYYYTRESLLHYARWMYKNEVPYKYIKDKVLIWTETWPAHDMRKSNVFDYAARYTNEPERSDFFQKAEYFYNSCIEDMFTFSTRKLLRPVVILANYGVMRGYCKKAFNSYPKNEENPYSFGQPEHFVPQILRVKRKLIKFGIFAVFILAVLCFMVLAL